MAVTTPTVVGAMGRTAVAEVMVPTDGSFKEYVKAEHGAGPAERL